MGWFIVSIFIPLIAPLIALVPFKWLPMPQSAQLNLDFMIPFKDGQLCWGALGFCASALYEIAEPGGQGAIVPIPFVGWANGGLIVVLLAASILAAGGAVFPTHMPQPQGVRWRKHFSTFIASLCVTVLAAGAYTVVHYGLLMNLTRS